MHVNVHNQAVALEQGNKTVGHKQAAGGVLPSHQGLAADNGACAHVHLDLIPRDQFALPEGGLKSAVKFLV